MSTLSKKEAIQAMREGKKVTHKNFLEDEFIYQDSDNWYRTEEGYRIESESFWLNRTNKVFETGWSIYNN